MKRLTYLSIVGWVACSWLMAGCGGSLTFLHDDDDVSDDDDAGDDDVVDDDDDDVGDDDDNAGACGEVEVFFDFESDDGGFTHGETNDGFDDPWDLGEDLHQPCYSGDQCWATNLTGDYDDCNAGELVSPLLDLSACQGSGDGVTLRFAHIYRFEAQQSGTLWDGGTVQLSADGGDTWVSHSPIPGFTGVIDGNFDGCEGDLHDLYGEMGWGLTLETWEDVIVNIGDDLRVEDFRFRFLFGSDQGSTDTGWTIDDVEIRVE